MEGQTSSSTNHVCRSRGPSSVPLENLHRAAWHKRLGSPQPPRFNKQMIRQTSSDPAMFTQVRAVHMTKSDTTSDRMTKTTAHRSASQSPRFQTYFSPNSNPIQRALVHHSASRQLVSVPVDGALWQLGSRLGPPNFTHAFTAAPL